MNVGGISIQNKRQNQQDRIVIDAQHKFYAIFDGHGGDMVSQFILDNYLNLVIEQQYNYQQQVQQKIMNLDAIVQQNINWNKTGSTISILQIFDQQLFLTSLGDSQIMLLHHDFSFQLSPMHKPDQEQARLKKGGFQIINSRGVNRIGGLAVSRSLGDQHFRQFGIIAEAEIQQYEINQYCYAFLACDGVFDVFKPNLISDLLETFVNKQVVNKHGSRMKTLQCFFALLNQQFDEGFALLKSLGGYQISKCWVDFSKNPEDVFCQLITFMLSNMSALDNLSCILVKLQ